MKLSDAWPRCHDGDKAAFRIISAFYRILHKATESREACLALIDVGPNLGAINRAAIIAAQHVVISLEGNFGLMGFPNNCHKVLGRDEKKELLFVPVDDLNLDSLDCGLKTLSSLSSGYAVSLVKLDELYMQLLEAGIYLTPLEQTRFLEFKYEKRKIEWLGGRIAAKHAVMRLLTPDRPHNLMNWHKWCVVPDKHNRPFIESSGTTRKNSAPYISISHSNGLAVAMASATPCGIDIQRVSSTVTRVKEKFMRPEENEILTLCGHIAEMDAAARLTLLWSAKEAFKKTFFLTPLPGFLELSLIKASWTLKRGLVLDFIYSKQDARSKKEKVFSAAAGFHEDFAVAATSVSSRDCIQPGETG